MKGKLLVCGILTILAFLMLGGCNNSPPPAPVQPPKPVQPPREVIREIIKEVEIAPYTLLPLTNSILQRLKDPSMTDKDNVMRYQLILFGGVFLERNDFKTTPTVIGGAAKLENVYVRKNITIPDQTEGQALDIDGEAVELTVCFDKDDIYQLKFSPISSEPEPYFYLQYDDSTAFGDVKGTVQYGEGDPYTLRYSGDKKPYLLIKLSQKDTEQLDPHTAPGRKVN
jgi:hypothetical protein